MPLFELPLDELRMYRGSNPRPRDFDAYWDRALLELSHVDPDVQLVERQSAARFADAFDLWFTGVGGARIHAQCLKPQSSGPHAAILKFHGYAGNAGDWFEKLGWVAQGFVVVALDVRGQGGLSEDVGGEHGTTLGGHIVRGLSDSDPDKLLFRQIFLDSVELARIVMSWDHVDPTRVVATGWSQGGGLTLACAALEPRIAMVAPVYPFLSDYLRVWQMDLARDAYEGLSFYFKRFDPTHEHERETFTRLGYIDVQHLADRIRGRVMMGTALMDTICPPSTQFAAYNKMTAPKEMVLYPDFGHDDLPGHNDRIFEFLSQVLIRPAEADAKQNAGLV